MSDRRQGYPPDLEIRAWQRNSVFPGFIGLLMMRTGPKTRTDGSFVAKLAGGSSWQASARRIRALRRADATA